MFRRQAADDGLLVVAGDMRQHFLKRRALFGEPRHRRLAHRALRFLGGEVGEHRQVREPLDGGDPDHVVVVAARQLGQDHLVVEAAGGGVADQELGILPCGGGQHRLVGDLDYHRPPDAGIAGVSAHLGEGRLIGELLRRHLADVGRGIVDGELGQRGLIVELGDGGLAHRLDAVFPLWLEEIGYGHLAPPLAFSLTAPILAAARRPGNGRTVRPPPRKPPRAP